MMTPRDFRVSGSSLNPAFVEFDMSVEGFGCIFLPSIAPQGYSFDGQVKILVFKIEKSNFWRQNLVAKLSVGGFVDAVANKRHVVAYCSRCVFV